LVTVLIENGKPTAALTAISQLGQRTDFYGNLDYESARANQLLGRHQQALKFFEKALKTDSTNLDYLKYMGMTHFSSGDMVKAKELLSQVIQADPKNVLGHYHIGLIDFQSGKYDQAVQSFQKVLEREKQNQNARYWKARALEATGEPKQLRTAKSEYEQVSLVVQKVPELKKELCDVHWRIGSIRSRTFAEWNEADADLSRYLKCSPKNADAWFLRGRLRADLGRLENAISDFERAAKLRPKLGKAYAQNAFTRMRKRKYNEKVVQSLLQRSIRYDKALARPHYVLCNMIKERNKSQARSHCQQYLKLAPKGDNAAEARLLLRSF
jgi:tetratricopeptide (TPR) repeat protein